jgi:hypothetical protein
VIIRKPTRKLEALRAAFEALRMWPWLGMALAVLKQARFWIMWIAALAVVVWYYATDPDGGAETIARLQWLAWLVVLAGPVYLLRRALMDGARSNQAFRRAIDHPIGAGLVFLGLCLLTGLLFLAFAGRAQAQEPPAGALAHLPTLAAEITAHWPQASPRSALAAQVEQETCYSLTHRKCWSPTAELKTAREYGFGLGQLTVTSRFDNFAAARDLHPSLRDWQWTDRYDATRQLRTMVLMDRGAYRRLSGVPDNWQRLAMTLSAYNGGTSGVLADRRLCASIGGCDPDQWFGHVERHSLKAKTKTAGYGQSFFAINREYVRNVLYVRRGRYVQWFGEAANQPRVPVRPLSLRLRHGSGCSQEVGSAKSHRIS